MTIRRRRSDLQIAIPTEARSRSGDAPTSSSLLGTGRGQAPYAPMTGDAILAACRDAGISLVDVDGFASYSNDRSDPARLAAARGCR